MNTLKIVRFTPPGAFLQAEEEEDVVLLPNRYVTNDMNEGDEIEVFIYTDSEDRLVATTEIPFVKKGEFGYLRVVDTTRLGAYMDWGLLKDLFVPFTKQKTPFHVGEQRFIYVTQDELSPRLIGIEHIRSFLVCATDKVKKFDTLSILVLARTPLGFKVIADNRYEGMIYHNEIFNPVSVGEIHYASVKNVRNDGKLDLILGKIGKDKKEFVGQKVLEILLKNGGHLPLTYKSHAENISTLTGMSKKNFKQALTELLKEEIIILNESEICLK